ncbi:type I restriction enzyme S subunit [Variovorax sp. SG517]|uniref:restriction endonuclease subunit S n=1 Tax=Variovorax sp. SG517 TaxID=2587117 RepID=UPI00159E6579|nr:restriction endonuclease subunit S [Variovorax sp. SG517]NVM86679.1 type I restriction enzyme S subunit [Variovorax sp. SG517]
MELREPSVQYPTSTKRTELGILPADWEIAEIGAISETASGTTPPRSQHERFYQRGVHAWVKTLDLNNAEIRLTDESVTDCALQETSLRLFPAGSVLVAMYGGLRQIGRTGLLRIPAAVNQAITVVQPCREVLCPEFLLFYLNYRVGYWQSVASSSRKDPNITGADVRAFKLALPTVDEQQRIAAALADADALIDSLEQLLTKKRQTKQGAMKELFSGKRRLPGFTKKWDEIRIGDFTDCTAGGTPNTRVEDFWNGDIPWMNSGELHKKRVWDVEGRITVDGLKNSSAKWIPERCVLIGLAGQGKTRGTVAMNMIGLCTNQSIAAIFPSEEYDSEFLFHNLDWRYDELRELSAGDGGRGGLNLTLIRSIVVPKPVRSEQRAIATLLSDMDTEIVTIEARATKARALKQAMAQVLLTGRIRIKERNA